MNTTQTPHYWLFSKTKDLSVLFLPVWLTWIFCLLYASNFNLEKDLPLWMWIVFILGLDVSHVWSSIFRTYLDKEEFANHRKLLIYTPIVVFLSLFMVAYYSVALFWRVMAYIALHHFIKQQYGFLAIYRGKHRFFPQKIFGDKWVIYFSMLYPVVYWHFLSYRNFNWFVEGDFLNLSQYLAIPQSLFFYTNILYWLIILAWCIEELYHLQKTKKTISWAKVLWLLSTAGNWYIGIVWFNSEIIFSLTNVVAHGVPYIALIVFYVERKKKVKNQGQISFKFLQVLARVSLMILIILFLAFGEEFFWDMWLNREKQVLFNSFLAYPMAVFQSDFAKAFAFALLSIPQVSHYIIDGYIWKNTPQNPYLKQVFV